jgi:hypothetical protein
MFDFTFLMIIFFSFSIVYYRTCSSRDNSILCSRCFEGTRHDGHYVSTEISNDASNWCDCGDSDYWKVQLNCKYHSHNTFHTSVITDSFQCGAKLAIGETIYHCRYRILYIAHFAFSPVRIQNHILNFLIKSHCSQDLRNQ